MRRAATVAMMALGVIAAGLWMISAIWVVVTAFFDYPTMVVARGMLLAPLGAVLFLIVMGIKRLLDELDEDA